MSSSTHPQSLTKHFLTSPKFTQDFQTATQNVFLEKSGKGEMSKEILQKWLSWDRRYAQAYVRFASLLLANLRLGGAVVGGTGDLVEELVDLVLGSIVNVRRELKFFEDVAGKFGLDIACGEDEVAEGVKLYRAVFGDVSERIENGESHWIEGLVVMWGTEKCYLEAWRYAKSFTVHGTGEKDLDGGALRNEFIPNWTGDEFVIFVEEIERLLERMWSQPEEKVGRKVIEGVVELEVLEGWWERVLDVEKAFWPVLE